VFAGTSFIVDAYPFGAHSVNVVFLQGTLSKEEVENLLRHGAYDIFNEEKVGDGEAASNAYVEQDIDSILERHSRTVVHENTGSNSKAAGSTFSKATFSASTPGTKGKTEEIDIEDPDFWKVGVKQRGKDLVLRYDASF